VGLVAIHFVLVEIVLEAIDEGEIVLVGRDGIVVGDVVGTVFVAVVDTVQDVLDIVVDVVSEVEVVVAVAFVVVGSSNIELEGLPAANIPLVSVE
jgi:hypothetical protein